MHHFCYLICALFLLGQCKSQHTLDQDISEALVMDSVQPMANSFSALDGKWSGQFHIYQHVQDQDYEIQIPEKLTKDFLDQLQLTETSYIEVQQEYRSKSPYYQTVSISDTYLDNGVKKDIKSTGVNKIQDGKMWCVVEKPNEKIVHLGTSPENDVIVWQGYSSDPFRKEYFYETVLADTYEIVGYGYYGQDDPKKNPKMWFWGKYDRVK